MDRDPPPDATLTHAGVPPAGTGRVLIVACGALAREILALTRALPHVDLQCLPAILHNRPDAIPDAVAAAVRGAQSRYAQVFVAYADCGTGGRLADVCRDLGVEMVEGPHCYSFFEGNAAFADRTEDEIATFYLTDFLVRQFDAFVTRPLGLDRHPQLRDAYFGHYDTLCYLAQQPTDELVAKSKACAAFLNLRHTIRHTGYGDLQTTLRRWVGAEDDKPS